ncbi:MULTISPECIES: YhgE/Pip domain-containing protein [Microbacterium]|uniref:YhgE/Pip domain-containing protein n=1 Tax=Microbacterium TaxID=33882 RepID=UPI000B82AD16|nr:MULTISPECIES: YhgE/Pip domain-containing protein [Microbacterium]MBT2497427.1 YhgE/Pip domain-containing protein [Microbacterium sp. ISL-59]NJI61288.1 YhgE/Pip domain-containing protein [Microbacterium sp. B19(2022)]
MIAAFSPGSDFKRYYRGRMPRLAVAVIILMPLLYGALYLWAFWNPFGNVNHLPVAIVNLDEGADAMGEPLDAGTQVVKGIVDSGQLETHVVDEAEGTAGLEHGRYAFTITIPADFSEAIASAATGDPRQADLIFTYNDANNYLSTVIGQDAAAEVINDVTAQVGEQVFLAVATGIKGELPTIRQAAAGIETLNSGVDELSAGADQLATGLVTAKSGAGTLSAALDELVANVDGAVGQVERAVNANGLTTGELQQFASSIRTSTDSLDGALAGIAEANARARADLQAVIDDVRASGDDELAERLEGVQRSIEQSGVGQEVSIAFDRLRSDVDTLAGEFDNPSSRVNVILRAVESGGINNTLNQVTGKADELRSGADQLASGLVQLSDGANEISANMPALVAGTAELASGVESGMKLIPNWNSDQQSSFIKTLADPVVMKQVTNNEAKTFAYGFAPFFFGLALFVGGIIAWMLFTPLQARPLAQGLGSFRTVLASYAPTLAVGFLQATILYLVVRFGLGMEYANPWGTFGFMLLMVAMFMAMIQMFNAVLGPAVGRVLTLAFLMVQLTSAGGVYPVAVTTLPFQYIHWIDPMTATVTGLRFMILGGADYRLWVAIGTIALLTVVFLAISTLAARRNRQYNMDRLYPPVEV